MSLTTITGFLQLSAHRARFACSARRAGRWLAQHSRRGVSIFIIFSFTLSLSGTDRMVAFAYEQILLSRLQWQETVALQSHSGTIESLPVRMSRGESNYQDLLEIASLNTVAERTGTLVFLPAPELPGLHGLSGFVAEIAEPDFFSVGEKGLSAARAPASLALDIKTQFLALFNGTSVAPSQVSLAKIGAAVPFRPGFMVMTCLAQIPVQNQEKILETSYFGIVGPAFQKSAIAQLHTKSSLRPEAQEYRAVQAVLVMKAPVDRLAGQISCPDMRWNTEIPSYFNPVARFSPGSRQPTSVPPLLQTAVQSIQVLNKKAYSQAYWAISSNFKNRFSNGSGLKLGCFASIRQEIDSESQMSTGPPARNTCFQASASFSKAFFCLQPIFPGRSKIPDNTAMSTSTHFSLKNAPFFWASVLTCLESVDILILKDYFRICTA